MFSDSESIEAADIVTLVDALVVFMTTFTKAALLMARSRLPRLTDVPLSYSAVLHNVSRSGIAIFCEPDQLMTQATGLVPKLVSPMAWGQTIQK